MNRDELILEACVENLDECLAAEKQGADRLELCGRLDLDGLTPDLDLVKAVLKQVNIPVKVMVRPRGGDFVHTKSELEIMMQSISDMKALGVEEIVLGVLTEKNEINLEATQKLAKAAQPMKVTFHKAIDELNDPIEGIRQLMQIEGVSSVLTSGGQITAMDGAQVLQQMLNAASGDLKVIAAGRVTNENLSEVHSMIGAAEYHGKLIVGKLNFE